jgi:hypothetical protein
MAKGRGAPSNMTLLDVGRGATRPILILGKKDRIGTVTASIEQDNRLTEGISAATIACEQSCVNALSTGNPM